MGNSTRPLVIFHGAGSKEEGYGGCADGFGAAFAAWLKLGDEAEYLPMNYGDWPKLFEGYPQGGSKFDGREVYVLDFSFEKAQMNCLFHDAAKVVWLDHHKTAFEAFGASTDDSPAFICATHAGLGLRPEGGDYHHCLLDNNKSGAMLAWDYFHPDIEVPMLIKHIDDRDRWVFALPGSREYNAALWSRA